MSNGLTLLGAGRTSITQTADVTGSRSHCNFFSNEATKEHVFVVFTRSNSKHHTLPDNPSVHYMTTTMTRKKNVLLCLTWASALSISQGFVLPSTSTNGNKNSQLAAVNTKLSPLPKGISPFEKSVSKSIDIQGNFRKLAQPALEKAIQDGCTQLEIEFPPLAGGDKSKSQFDDFDNISELNANRDWCVQLIPSLQSRLSSPTLGKLANTWFILPDDKECELTKQEWTGQRYQSAAQFTSIRAACTAVAGQEQAKAWGSTLASAVNKLQGGDGILADSSTLDDLDLSSTRLNLVCQPGNGGPVEDWINVKQLHESSNPPQPTCIVNGALDKGTKYLSNYGDRSFLLRLLANLLKHLVLSLSICSARWLLSRSIFSSIGCYQRVVQ